MGYSMKSEQVLPPKSAQAASFACQMSLHARTRAQQRGINGDVLNCLLHYGRHEHDHMGCELVMFDDVSLEEVAKREPRALWRKADEARSLYAVVDSNGMVVTTGHRFRRVIRDKSLSSNRPGRSRSPQVLNASFNSLRFQ
jgi:hypothetical protein